MDSIHDEKLPETSSPPSSKPSSPVKEDANRKNFIPVPWRVIGGGVLVGIKKNDTDYDSALDSDDSSENPHPQIFNKGTGSPGITRKRSNSIPSTPSVAQIRVGSVSVIFKLTLSIFLSLTRRFSCSRPNRLEFYNTILHIHHEPCYATSL